MKTLFDDVQENWKTNFRIEYRQIGTTYARSVWFFTTKDGERYRNTMWSGALSISDYPDLMSNHLRDVIQDFVQTMASEAFGQPGAVCADELAQEIYDHYVI